MTNINTDIGLFYESINNTSTRQNIISSNDFTLYNSYQTGISLGNFEIFSNRNIFVATRNCLKVQNALTIVVSLFSAFNLLLNVILSPYIDKQYYESIAKHVINFDNFGKSNQTIEMFDIINVRYFFYENDLNEHN